MDIFRLKNLSAEDRRAVLDAEAISVEEGKYEKPLTPEELAYYKDEVSECSIRRQSIEDELKEIKKDFKEKLDPINQSIREALRNIKYKSVEKDGRLYKLPDYDNQMIHKVDELGNVISSRQMLPEERQFRISAQTIKSA